MNGVNETVDDTESVYTCYVGGACTVGTVNVNATPGSLTVNFSVTSPPPNATYAWDFGDGNSSTQIAPTHTYGSAGTYTGTVTANTGSATCAETFTVTVTSPAICQNNPALLQGAITPAPLTGTTGVLEFSFIENLNDYTAWQTDPIVLTLCLLNVSPQNGVSSVGGSYHQTFNWLYDASSNCFQGTQNKIIIGGDGGPITVDFKVDTAIVCPRNQLGFNVVLQPPACMASTNQTADDSEDAYTCSSINTNTEDSEWAERFELFPNPAAGKVTVLVESSTSKETTLTIINLAGKTVFSEHILFSSDVQTHALDISKLVPGIYFVAIQSTDGISTKKLIKY